jgi:hypothetical protein
MEVPGGRILAQTNRTDANGRARAVLDFDRSGSEVILRAGDFAGVGRVELGRILRGSYLFGRVTDGRSNKPVEDATLHVTGKITRSGTDGWYVLEMPEEESRSVEVRLRGYAPANLPIEPGASGRLDIELEPLFAGMLLGRRIVLDPLDGGTVELTRSNVELALGLRRWLTNGGARVWLTREDVLASPGKLERVRLALDRESEIFVSLAHFITKKPEVSTYRYYLDRDGLRLSRHLAEALSDSLGVRSNAGLESSAYEMIQPRGARTTVFLGVKAAPDDSKVLRDESRALFVGILRFWGVDEEVSPPD